MVYNRDLIIVLYNGHIHMVLVFGNSLQSNMIVFSALADVCRRSTRSQMISKIGLCEMNGFASGTYFYSLVKASADKFTFLNFVRKVGDLAE